MTRFFFALLVTLQIVFTMAAQGPAKATGSNDIFAGTVTVSTPDSITVVRRVPARADEYRSFVIDNDTKTEGKLRVSARVSVQFKANDDGAVHALRIIVRADAKTTPGAGKAPSPAAK